MSMVPVTVSLSKPFAGWIDLFLSVDDAVRVKAACSYVYDPFPSIALWLADIIGADGHPGAVVDDHTLLDRVMDHCNIVAGCPVLDIDEEGKTTIFVFQPHAEPGIGTFRVLQDHENRSERPATVMETVVSTRALVGSFIAAFDAYDKAGHNPLHWIYDDADDADYPNGKVSFSRLIPDPVRDFSTR